MSGLEVLMGIFGALICLSGLCSGLCLLYARLLLPESARGTWTVVWGTGRGEELEQRVRSLMWLRECGVLRSTVLLADDGLDEQGRALAVRLAKRWPGLMLCRRDELEQRLKLW